MNKINKKYFKPDNSQNRDENNNGNRIVQMTCYSCHHGKENPESKPPAQAAPAGGTANEHKS